jgi:S-(hydroxymethyl)glutathione dehydrogenase/alcohol dehydrogenase
MKAAILYEPTKLELVEVDVDEPGVHEVLVRTIAAGICGTDHAIYTGRNKRQLPLAMGHESAGIVEAIGSEVSSVEVGDHVVTCVSVFCGHCEFCISGRPALCLKREADVGRTDEQKPRLSRDGVGLTQMSGLASWGEQLLVHENAVVAIDAEVPLEVAALLGCGVTTGLASVFRTADVRPGASVAVIGCGGVGLSIVQGARIAGARRIVGIDTDAGKLEMAQAVGATDTIDAGDADVVDKVLGLTDGGVEFSFEAIGNPRTAIDAFMMLRAGGLATFVGVQRGNTLELPGGHFAHNRRVQGTYMGNNRFRLDIPYYVDLYRQGRLQLDQMVTERIGQDDLPQALAEYGKPGSVRTAVIFE